MTAFQSESKTPEPLVGKAEAPGAAGAGAAPVRASAGSFSYMAQGSFSRSEAAPTPAGGIGADFYHAAVLNAGIPIVTLDAAGSILAWNSAAVRLFGKSQEEVVGQSLETLIPAEYRPVAAKAFQRTIQQRSVNVYEMSLVPQGGKHPVHLGVTLSCVIDGGGLKGVIAWMRDISNRKELEDHLTRTRHMASVGTLAAGVAHHFNNIACGMGAMVEFAMATEDHAAMLKALRMAAEASSRIAYITQSLLACSGSEVEGGEVDLSDLTEEILRFADAVEPTLQQKGIALQLELQSRRIAAVPRVRFGQALQHLLRNSQDAIEERAAGGGAWAGGENRITIRTQSQGDQIMVQFVDTGIGIEPDDLPHIFDPFFTKKGCLGGGGKNNPGLGLTLAHSVVMEMGGHIWADSSRGGAVAGTTIHILMPVVV